MIESREILPGKKSQLLIDGDVVAMFSHETGSNVSMLTHDISNSEVGDLARYLDHRENTACPDRLFLFPGVRRHGIRAKAIQAKQVNTYDDCDESGTVLSADQTKIQDG